MSGTSNSALSNGTPANGQGSNSANIRQFNERVILHALRRLGQASKADLSRHVNLTNNTAGVIVKDLEERKLIRGEGKRSTGVASRRPCSRSIRRAPTLSASGSAAA